MFEWKDGQIVREFQILTHNHPEDELTDSDQLCKNAIEIIPKRKLTLKEIKALPSHERTGTESIKFAHEDPKGYWKESDQYMKDLDKITRRWDARK